MKPVLTDVDIDCFNRDAILSELDCVFAKISRENKKHEKHPSGVYFQNIPKNAKTNIATLDYKEASDYGYFKVDFLNVHLYGDIKSEQHLLKLLDTEPNWEFFEYQDITDQLFHLNGHSNLLKKYKPRSVEDLAMILAIIRPSKAYLQGHDWDKIRKEVWLKTTDVNYQFKRSHSLSYAIAIVVHLNLLTEKWSSEI